MNNEREPSRLPSPEFLIDLRGKIDKYLRVIGAEVMETSSDPILLAKIEEREFFFEPVSGDIFSEETLLVRLTPPQSRILAALARQPGCVFRGNQITGLGWPDDQSNPYDIYRYEGERTRRMIDRIRKNLGKISPELEERFETIKGVGYRWNQGVGRIQTSITSGRNGS